MRISDWSSDVCSSDLLIDQNIALGAQFAGIASLTEDTRPGIAPAIAKPREGDFDQPGQIQLCDQHARIVARLHTNDRRVGLAEAGFQRKGRLHVYRIIANTYSILHRSPS